MIIEQVPTIYVTNHSLEPNSFHGYVDLAAGKDFPPLTGYTAAWPERCAEQWRYGLILGALRGLRAYVDKDVASKLDKIIKECEPYNGRTQPPHE